MITINRNKYSKKLFLLFFAILLILFPGLSFSGGVRNPKGKYLRGEVLVKFKKNPGSVTRFGYTGKSGGKTVKDFAGKRISLVKLENGQSVDEAVESFKKDPDVEYVQPNHIYRINAIPDDTYYNQLWGIKRMGLEPVWDKITDCTGVTVAVIDSGVNYNNEDLISNMWDDGSGNPGYDFVDDDNDPMDFNGHGTHVAGTIGAGGNNGTGVTGICWNVKIMALRAIDQYGSGSDADIISALYYAIDNGAKIVNFSLGGFGGSQGDLFSQAIDDARAAGILIIAAAGNDENDNDGPERAYPASYTQDNIISVAALDQSYLLAFFSNYGAVSVDVSAPGVDILSSIAGDENSIGDNFVNGWIQDPSSPWAYSVSDDLYSGMNFNYLVIPGSWPAGYYGNNLNAWVYKTFSLTGNEDLISLHILSRFDLQAGDYFSIHASNSAGTIFESQNLIIRFGDYFNTTDDYYYGFNFDISGCSGSMECTVGFRFTSNGSGGDKGVGIVGSSSDGVYPFFSLDTLRFSNNSYNSYSGTSMAAPHVTGLAAMIMAYNPKYSYLDVVESIKNGGESVTSLKGRTLTGKAVNAWGSLRYIQPVTGLRIDPI